MVRSLEGSAKIIPRATAMGSPIIPVPGMPTPMAFLSILALKRTSMDVGDSPRVWAACAAAKATATGSVHPVAGTTSFLISSIH